MATSGLDIDGYAVDREIGRGAFAIVYQATQLSIERPVALKVITSGALDAEMEQRFRSECRTVGSLSWHPNVVALYDAGISPVGLPFLAMEYLPSGSLASQLRSGRRFTPPEIVSVGIEISDALSAAHEAGVLHRDVKPDNVMIGRRGEHKLGDFGVATLNDGSRSATSTFAGTYAYCAPELLKGDRATPSSDVYSLGATLYALASGRPAFLTGSEETPAAVMWRLMTEPPPPLPESVPTGLRSVIERAMSKEPSSRYERASDLQRALAAIAPSGAGTGPVDAETFDADATVVRRRPVSSEIGSAPAEDDAEATVLRPAPRPSAPMNPLDDGWTAPTVMIRPSPAADPSTAAPLVVTGQRSARKAGTMSEILDLVQPSSFATDAHRQSGRPMRSIWLPNHTDDTLTHLDPDTNLVVAIPSVGRRPVSVLAEPGCAWSVDHDSGTVTKVDAHSNQIVGSIEVGSGPVAIMRGSSGLWVTNYLDGTVARIGAAGAVDRTITVGSKPSSLVEAFGALWVTNSGEGTVSCLDPSSGAVLATMKSGRRPFGSVAAGGLLFVSNWDSGTVVAINPRSRTVLAKISVGKGAGHPIADGESVWVTSASKGTLSCIAVRSTSVDWTVPVASQPGTPVLGSTGVWLCSGIGRTVARVDPQRKAVAARTEIGSGRFRLIRGDRVIWLCNVDTGQIRAVGISGPRAGP